MHRTRRSKRNFIPFLLSLVALVGAVTLSVSLQQHPSQAHAATANIDVSQRPGNESEETVAVNPTNPNNIVIVTNVDHPAAGMFAAVSFNGGTTWNTRLIGDNDNLGDACCDPSLSFDSFGNLFLTYLYNVENEVTISLSTHGGLNFNLIANTSNPPKTTLPTSADPP